jgi:YHS domain-containing protein
MIVGANHAAGRLRHADRDYYFCSLECVRAFAADPTRYVDDSA